MLRLFKVGKDFFESKAAAKEYRGKGQVVEKGPDHMGNHGSKGRKARAEGRCGT